MLVVLADKDPYDLQALQAVLSAPGREVLILADGENIITLAESRSPDVVVVGSSLGQMGGLAVSRELKMYSRAGRFKEPKVIVLLERSADSWITGWSQCDAYLVKPCDPEAVEDLVEELAPQPA